MVDVNRNVTKMAKRAVEVNDVMDHAHQEATGLPRMSIDVLADHYLMSSYEEREAMFFDFMDEQGIDGIKVLQRVMQAAHKKWQEEPE